ncbi:Hsp70 family protein [Nonomuraea bangladeshensis]|uniref:Hsp70 family protein n=1 Tax=Nonomuraea bangladeshensis TaxID=404385 RepID=UPI003C2E3F2D
MSRPRYAVGLDLGDGESAIAWVECTDSGEVRLYDRGDDEVSVVTAMARGIDGTELLGEAALLHPEVRQARVNFKTRPRRTRVGLAESLDIVDFARLFVSEFGERYPEVLGGCRLYIGHPAGWDQATVAVYREQLEGALRPLSVQLVPESQSAFLHVHDQARVDPETRPVLVVDVGSSTIDFTLVTDGPENLPYGDELGCRRIDEEIRGVVLEREHDPAVRERLAQPTAAGLLSWLCRRHKEAAFSGLSFPRPTARPDSKLRWVIDTCWPALAQVDVEALVRRPGGWLDRFRDELRRVRGHLGERLPLIVLTAGGGARMPLVGQACAEVFAGATIDPVAEPSLAVARGLASYGRWRLRVEEFRDAVRALTDSSEIDDCVSADARGFTRRLYTAYYQNQWEAIFEPILAEVNAGVPPREAVGDMKAQQRRLFAWLATPAARPVRDRVLGPLEDRINGVLRPAADRLCAAHGLPSHALNTRVALPPTIFLRPPAALLPVVPLLEKVSGPLMAGLARSRVFRASLRGQLRILKSAGPRAGSLYRLNDGDIAELTHAVREEVTKQLLQRVRSIEMLLAVEEPPAPSGGR